MSKISEFFINTWNSFPKIYFYIFLIAIIVGCFLGIEKAIYTIFILAGAFIGFIWLKKLGEWLDKWFNLSVKFKLLGIWIKSIFTKNEN